MAQGIQLPVVQTGLSQSINQAVKQVGTINIPATIDPSAFKNLAQPLGRVSGLATEFEKSIAASNARVLAFGASVGIINGVQGAFADLLKTGIEVQKTLADIAAISGQGGRELSKFGDALFDVAKTTGQSFKTASQAALEFSRQGLGTQETLKRTTDALTLTRFTTLNAAEAVDVLTAAANSFSSTGITTAQIINKLVAVDTKFAVSAEDLANGLSRAGSIAQEVGVSFDELNAAITVAQERTARGGAVIGNALKTIFTRLRSDETVEALRNIGVESLNAQGGLKGAIPLLQEVANKVQNLSGGERVQILEAVASKYNINILSALLDDLNNANSKFGQAVSVSAGASNQAYERQIQLNKTLAAELNRASVSATQLFNKLSEIGVTDSLATLLKYVNNIVDSFNKLLDSEGVGGNIARGLVKGISDVFFTVGLPIIAAIFVKLTADIAKFGVESLKTILQINQQSRERVALEQAVVNTLIRDQEIMATILSLSSNRAKQEEYLLGVYNRQLAALQQVQNIASSVTPALMAGGLTAMSGQIKKRGAGGYLPAQEAADVRRGVGGASPSSKVVSIPNFAFGGGKRGTMIANTSEYIVPNFANGGSAIFNQNMVKAYGLPAGAKKISAAGGYIPNYANIAYQYTGKGDIYRGVSGKEFPLITSNNQYGKTEEQKAAFQDKYVKTGIYKKIEKQEDIDRLVNEDKARKTEQLRNAAFANGAVMLVPQGERESLVKAYASDKDALQNGSGAIFDIFPLEKNIKSEASGAQLKNIKNVIESAVQNVGLDIVNSYGPINSKPFDKEKFLKLLETRQGSQGATAAAAGAIFEAATLFALNPELIGVNNPAVKNSGNTLDVQSLTPQLINAFGIDSQYGASTKADFKISASGGNKRKFAEQILKNKTYQSASKGYIPNFAAGSPLGDAINREMAAGLKPSQIRVTTDGRLKNSQNPNGFAVINTRDEPNGRIPNFAKPIERQTKTGESRYYSQDEESGKLTRISKEAFDKLNNSSTKLSIGMDKMLIAMSATMMATSTLEATFGKTNSEFGKAAIEVGKAASSMTQFASLGALIPGAGPYGAIAGAVLGAGMYGYQYATEPTKIADEQRQNIYQQQLNPQGDIKKQIEQVKRDLAVQQRVEMAAKIDIAKYSPDMQYSTDSEFGYDANKNTNLVFAQSAEEDLAKVTPQIKKLQELLDKLQGQEADAAKKAAEEQAKAKKELENRVALSKVIGNLNIAYAQGEATALTERAKKYAEITQNASKLTEAQKRQQENTLKIGDIQEKINNVEKDTLYNLVKEVADKSKLATITEKELKILQEKYEANDKNLNLEEEAKKLGIQGAANLESLLIKSKENATIAKIKLEAEKTALKTQLDAVDAGSLQAAQIKNRINFLQSEYDINKQIADLKRNSLIEEGQFQRSAAVRNLKKEIAGKRFVSPQDTARLKILEQDTEYAEKRNKIQEDFESVSKTSFTTYLESARSSVIATTGLSEESKKNALELLRTAENAEQVTSAIKTLKAAREEDKNTLETITEIIRRQEEAYTARNKAAEGKKGRDLESLGLDPKLTAERTRDLLTGSVQGGIYDAFTEIQKDTSSFSETFGKNTTIGFRDGLRDAMSAAISQTDDLNGALQNVAMNFLKNMQGMFMNQAANSAMMGLKSAFPSVFKFAKGGLVSGGSGYRDDVPAMLTGGEFVMRKSAVQKYGAANLAKMNNGGIFLPGVRGSGAISGYDALRAFANQTTTSGATDVLRGGGSSAFINLEDQSSKLSRYALLNDDTINQEIRSAQEQGLNIISQREAYRTQQRKAMQQQLVSTVASAVLSAGIGALGKGAATAGKGSATGLALNDQALGKTQFLTNAKSFAMPASSAMPASALNFNYTLGGRAYGGMIRRYASGGPTDDIPALLMSGEYVMNRQTTSKYGKRLLDSMNQGRAPRFADGGDVGSSQTMSSESTSKMTGDVNISINVTGQNSETQTQGESNQGGVDYKKMSEKIKAIVLETINEEKRLGGALRTR